MACKLCLAATPPVPANRRCAFEDGSFDEHSWHCGTILALRLRALTAVSADVKHAPDTHRCAVIGHEGVFVLLVWYDNEPTADRAIVLRPHDSIVAEEALTLELAEEILEVAARRTA